VNLWSWRDIYSLEWAWDDEVVWIRQNAPETLYWAPVGPWDGVDWSRAFSVLPADALPFVRVPEELALRWDAAEALFCELSTDEDHWDYLYSVPDLVQLSGNRFHKKKNLLNQFERKYEYRYTPLGPEMIDKALTLQTEWCVWRDCEDSTTLEAENQAILNTFHDWNELEGAMGAGLLVDGNMVGFTVGEPLDADTLVIHFEKGCPHYKGVYQAINQKFLANEGQAFNYVNREQDLGDPGLRKAKRSYNPLGYLKKCSGRVRLRSSGRRTP
jgi:hypothetical protein